MPGSTSDTNSDGYITKDDIVESSGKYNCAVLNLSGNGTINAIGGKAGNGFSCRAARGSGDPSDKFGAGGGGAGAGIGGNGGDGGIGATGNNSGQKGEACGIINISNGLNVYAYGGGGGAGGQGWGEAGGGGGYPAAGIGGGGAGGGGGTCCTGSGGYSGGNSGGGTSTWPGTNGFRGNSNGGGGYFSSFGDYSYKLNGVVSTGNSTKDFFGGMSRLGEFSGAPYGHRSGNGGIAGAGGIINKSTDSNVYAYNGNMYTGDEFEFSHDNLRVTKIIYYDGHEYNNGDNQCPIYLQLGITIDHYNWLSNATYSNLNLEARNINSDNTLSGYTNSLVSGKISVNSLIDNKDKNILGVGSGAGYIEMSNGTYTVN